MRIQLSDHFGYGRLLKFVFPSISMMIFTSIYCVVDGLFVSNFVGKIPFAAINLMMPLFMILSSFGFMIGAGGAAIVGKTLGQGKKDKANEYFSMLVYVTLAFGAITVLLGQIFLPDIAQLFGAKDEMLECSVLYGRILILAVPFYMLQNLFQSFFITAEKPKLGLFVIVLAGVTNMMLDFLLVAVIPLGLTGAAIATSVSQVIGAFVPLFYFFKKNDSLLRLCRTKFYSGVLVKTCINGSSELMSNISMSVVTILYNHQLMKYAGDNGVAAYGVIMYVGFVIVAIFIGYSMGSAPLISFNFGAENKLELKNIFKKSGVIIGSFSISLVLLSFLFAYPLSAIFVGYDAVLLEMTVKGFRIYSFAFLFCGVSIFGSAFFTALNNGVISAVISFLRTFVFQVAGVLILPLFFENGLDGIWYSIIVAEALSFVITLVMIITNKKKYGYL